MPFDISVARKGSNLFSPIPDAASRVARFPSVLRVHVDGFGVQIHTYRYYHESTRGFRVGRGCYDLLLGGSVLVPIHSSPYYRMDTGHVYMTIQCEHV